MDPLVRTLTNVSLHDIKEVGGKAASLGEMLQQLASESLRIPHGFVITTAAYRMLLRENDLESLIQELSQPINDTRSLFQIAKHIRLRITQANIPEHIIHTMREHYHALAEYYQLSHPAVAVRSSATAEDLPTASFAGQQESFLNVVGVEQLAATYLKTTASLFTDRALIYRKQHNIPQESVAIAVCVQKMVRSDKACAGVMFTLDPESGFPHCVTINAAYGLGELVVQGDITPDEYTVYKGHPEARPILKRQQGNAREKLIINNHNILEKAPIPRADYTRFVLSSDEIQQLTTLGMTIEDHYSARSGAWCPMDIEWAKDGDDGQLYIVQARPETVYSSQQKPLALTRYRITTPLQERTTIVTGQSIGRGVVSGKAHVVVTYDPHLHETFIPGDILVTTMTDPDWVPLLRKAGAVITNQGGRTCHAAIVSRELGIPAIIGTEQGTHLIKNGDNITVDCSEGSQGFVYHGHVSYTSDSLPLQNIPQLPFQLLVNIGQPESAYSASQLPVQGVGLARLEFIIAQTINVHPLAVVHPEKITDNAVLQRITERAAPYGDPVTYFVERLAEGIGTIAAAFYPRPVIVRLTDLKSNEYRHLLGGAWFEPEEENPMIGWRGASRYVTPHYEPAFALECKALHKVRELWGFTNVHLMVPFVRSVPEALKVAQLLTHHGISRHHNGLLWYMMVELPANVILLEHFAPLFDGFSIGSNDLTQLTLGVDRDSSQLQQLFDERNPAVMALIKEAIRKSHAAHRHIGICGEAPSHYPEFVQFLTDEKIDSISLSPDAVLPYLIKASVC
jgi:pyruvate,water dikinase